jgi:GT2 family glycosyltransferase
VPGDELTTPIGATFDGAGRVASELEEQAVRIEPAPSAAEVDVVVVSYNSRNDLRKCVEPLANRTGLVVSVVDNASSDGSLDSVSDLEVNAIALEQNRGFAHGCNRGWIEGHAPFVLFLNPDAQIDPSSIWQLVQALKDAPKTAAAAPKVMNLDGGLDYSLRRFPRLRSTYAQALFLHRFLPHASWTDELVREPEAYERRHEVDWVSGVCLLVRREVLEELGGWDAGFFMYCEDIDLCRRIRDLGFEIEFVPNAQVLHEGGASAPRPALLPTLAASRLRYASKHSQIGNQLVERLGIALGAITHIVISRGGKAARLGHARALAVAAGLRRPPTP